MKTPEGATFTRDDTGQVRMGWPTAEGTAFQSLPSWLADNCAPGTSAELIETAAGEIIGVSITGPSSFEIEGAVTGRRFRLVRYEDVSEVSGVGVVAHGVQFPDGNVALRWAIPGMPPSTAVWDSVEAVEMIHGHQGKTVVEWLD